MGKVISISMNKGGVGKTSLVANLSGAIALTHPSKKILIVDTDGQGNTSIAFGKNPNKWEKTVYDVLLGDINIKDAIVQVYKNIDLLPANDDMNFLELDVLTNVKDYPNPFNLLKNALSEVIDNYEYIVIDTPPSLGLVAGNVMLAADEIIIPFVPETFAVQGLIRIIQAIEDFKAKQNPTLNIKGVVGMMTDLRTTLHTEMLQEARKFCDQNNIKLYWTVIPRSIRFASTFAYDRLPAVFVEQSNPIVSAYFELMKEVLEENE